PHGIERHVRHLKGLRSPGRSDLLDVTPAERAYAQAPDGGSRGLVAAAGPRGQAPGGRGGADVIDDETKAKALGRLRRIEGQVQGIQRMVEEEKYCVDILLQLTAVEGAVEQVQRLLLGRHIESCVADAIRSGRRRARPKNG